MAIPVASQQMFFLQDAIRAPVPAWLSLHDMWRYLDRCRYHACAITNDVPQGEQVVGIAYMHGVPG